MPRKSLDELEAKPEPAKEEKKADAVVVATEDKTTRKVKLDLEVDTSVKDMGPNPYAKIIHMARAVDAWRIFPRLFLTVYIILLYRCVIWYMNLADPTMEQSGLISIVVGAGAAWFGLYTGTDKSRK
tara:strand:+ start:600 stop:980 length:381 start_codon:yes stop_codon:yes gene_type:complete